MEHTDTDQSYKCNRPEVESCHERSEEGWCFNEHLLCPDIDKISLCEGCQSKAAHAVLDEQENELLRSRVTAQAEWIKKAVEVLNYVISPAFYTKSRTRRDIIIQDLLAKAPKE